VLDELNIGLVAIGSGTSLMANGFQKEFKFQGSLFCDKDRAAYKALGCNRGLKYVINSKTLEASKNAVQKHPNGSIQGDALQLGGVFVISKKSGVLFQHLEEYAGDHVDVNELANTCRDLAADKSNY